MAREEDDKAAERSDADKPPNDDTGSAAAEPAGRRPPHTIDLKAEEVEAEEATEESASAEAESEPETDEEKAGEAAKAKRREPPQRTTPGQVRGFVTHLAAGLMGGLAGILGAGYALDKLGPIAPPAVEAPETAGKLTAIEDRLARLEEGRAAEEGFPAAIKERASKLEETAKTLDSRLARVEEGLKAQEGLPAAIKDRAAQLEETTKTLDGRLARVEEALKAQEGFPAAMKERVARLEATIKTLGQAAAEGGDVAQTAAVAQQIADLSTRLDARFAKLRGDVDALRARLDALPGPGADKAVTEDLARRLGELERKVDVQASAAKAVPEGLTRRLDELEQKVGSLAAREVPAGEGLRGAALAVRFTALTRAIDRGAPFARELKALREVAPRGLDFSALTPQAEKATPTLADLAQRFKAESAAALEAARRAAGGESLVSQLLTNARSLVRVRRIDGATGDSAAAIVSRMAASLKTGDLEAALDESEKLPEGARTALAAWLASARARIALDAARDSFAEQLTRQLAVGGSSGAQQPAGGQQ